MFALPIVLALAFTGPTSGPTPFAAFVDAYFDGLYAFAPSLGTAAGFHQYDTRIEDRAAPAIKRRIDTLMRQRAEPRSAPQGTARHG